MKLATEIDHLKSRIEVPLDRIQILDRMGYDFVFTSENTGSDVMTPLGFVLGSTQRIGVGTSIAVTAARSPAATASAFLTLAQLGGASRPVIAGIGNSSPGRSEGWHGRRWGSPGNKLRDYVAIMRKVFAGEFPLTHEGPEISVPYRGTGGVAVEPLSGLQAPNLQIPIMLGTGAESMIELTAEIADGWLSLGFAPGMMTTYRPMLEAGFARAGRTKTLDDFEIWSHVDVIVSDDVEEAMKPFKAFTALHAGGWAKSGKTRNIYAHQMIWRGYAKEQQRIEELYLAGRVDEAAAAVPDEYIDDGWLVGPISRIAERARRWRDAGPTGLIIRAENPDVYGPIEKAVRG